MRALQKDPHPCEIPIARNLRVEYALKERSVEFVTSENIRHGLQFALNTERQLLAKHESDGAY
jgi:hypothetical protein